MLVDGLLTASSDFVAFFVVVVFTADDEEEPGDCRNILVSLCDFCGGWICTLGPLTVKLRDPVWGEAGREGRSWELQGRVFKVSVGERAVQEQSCLGR